MKKLFATVLLIACFVLLLASCGEDARVNRGSYVCDLGATNPATISFTDEDSFELVFPGIVDGVVKGDYDIEKDRLILDSKKGEYHLEFTVTPDGLVFDLGASTDVSVPDGSVFVYYDLKA